jgi:hypothetical protein
MKRFISLGMLLIVLAAALGIPAGAAKADGFIVYEGAQFVVGTGIVFTFEGEAFRSRDFKGANIFVGSDFYDLYCWVRKGETRIVCVASGGLTEFAGQTGVIYLAGQIFYVTIPFKHGSAESGGQSLTCEDGEVLGAEYMVDFGSGPDGPYFVPGDTLDDADALAAIWFAQAVDYYGVNGLVCDEEPS